MLKLFIEFGPLFVFFLSYKYTEIFWATGLMLTVTLFCLFLSYLLDKKLSIPLLLSGVVLTLVGVIAYASGDAKYIKMKPTIVYIIFGVILYIGTLRNRAFTKEIFGEVFNMAEDAWLKLSKRFALFFFSMAIINEIVWRNFHEVTWVNFKIFGAIPLTLLFVASQIPFLHANSRPK